MIARFQQPFTTSKLLILVAIGAASVACGTVVRQAPDGSLGDGDTDGAPGPTVLVQAPQQSTVIVRDDRDETVASQTVDETQALRVAAPTSRNISVIVPAAVGGTSTDTVFAYFDATAGDTLYAYPTPAVEPTLDYALVLPPAWPPNATVTLRTNCGATEAAVGISIEAPKLALRKRCRTVTISGSVLANNTLASFYAPNLSLNPEQPRIDLSATKLDTLVPYNVSYSNPSVESRTGFLAVEVFDGRIAVGLNSTTQIINNPSTGLGYSTALPPLGSHQLHVTLSMQRPNFTQTIDRLGLPADVAQTILPAYELPRLAQTATFDSTMNRLAWAEEVGGIRPHASSHALTVTRKNAGGTYEIRIVAPYLTNHVRMPTLPEAFARYQPSDGDSVTVNRSSLLFQAPQAYRGIIAHALTRREVYQLFHGNAGAFVQSTYVRAP